MNSISTIHASHHDRIKFAIALLIVVASTTSARQLAAQVSTADGFRNPAIAPSNRWANYQAAPGTQTKNVSPPNNIQQTTYLYPGQQGLPVPPMTLDPNATNTAPAINYQIQPNQNFQTQLPGQVGASQNGILPPNVNPNFNPNAVNVTPGFIQPRNAQPIIQQPSIINGPQQAELDVYVPQSGTGRFTIGGTYSSDNNLTGQVILEERDWGLPQRGQWLNPLAYRGDGLTFRLEATPGQDLQRYLISIANPYFRGTEYSSGISGYFFERQYFDWDEQRAGGRVSLGRRLDPLSFAGFVAANGERDDRQPASQYVSSTEFDAWQLQPVSGKC